MDLHPFVFSTSASRLLLDYCSNNNNIINVQRAKSCAASLERERAHGFT